MIYSVDTILSLVLLSILLSFGSSRLPVLIKVLAFQGLAVSIVPMVIGHDLTVGGLIFTQVTLVIRGIVIPLSLYIAIKKVAIRREVEPIVGYNASLLAGLGLGGIEPSADVGYFNFDFGVDFEGTGFEGIHQSVHLSDGNGGNHTQYITLGKASGNHTAQVGWLMNPVVKNG